MGLNTITDFLLKKGINADMAPNALVAPDVYAVLEKEFGSNKSITGNERDNIREKIQGNRQSVTIDAGKKAAQEEQEVIIKSNVISVKDEVRGPKILGKIDLNPKKKEEEKPAPAPAPEKPKAEPKREEPKAEKPAEKPAEPKTEPKAEPKAEVKAEPHTALFGGNDGLDFYRAILDNFSPKECFIFEIGYDQEEDLRALCAEASLPCEIFRDYGGNVRGAVIKPSAREYNL